MLEQDNNILTNYNESFETLLLGVDEYNSNLSNYTPLPKIAFITAIHGSYEKSCKKFVEQTIASDFICFTNNLNVNSNNWIVDYYTYHLKNPSNMDDGTFLNSLKNNQHTFNVAKYYKQSFHNIPRLKDYDIIIWIDGSIEITNPRTAEISINSLKSHSIATWDHMRNGSLRAEAYGSLFDRYTSTNYLGQKQPYQDVVGQYKHYLKEGYNESLWKEIAPDRPQYGVWVTCFVAFRNDNKTHHFLDLWYLQTLNFSTQDQVGFPYTVQKTKLFPYSFPDGNIQGTVDKNNLFIKHYHGK